MERLEELYLKYGQPVRQDMFQAWIGITADILKTKLDILVDQQRNSNLPNTNRSKLIHQRKMIDLQILQDSLNDLELRMTYK